jgi:hypothetical protein
MNAARAVTCSRPPINTSKESNKSGDQFNAGGMFWTLPERRFWAVDEDLGIVMVIFMFRSELPEKSGDGPPPMMTPMMAHNATAEMFKIKNGRIYQIEAVIGPMLPYGQRSGW